MDLLHVKFQGRRAKCCFCSNLSFSATQYEQNGLTNSIIRLAGISTEKLEKIPRNIEFEIIASGDAVILPLTD